MAAMLAPGGVANLSGAPYSWRITGHELRSYVDSLPFVLLPPKNLPHPLGTTSWNPVEGPKPGSYNGR
jgi:hypothetical protein